MSAPRRDDLFEDWYRAPVEFESDDPRFEVRRLRPSEYETMWSLVDAAFGRRRPRAEYTWMYRDNPNGLARCWGLFERATGALLNADALFPWPVQRGAEPMLGSITGDSVTHPDRQRQGLTQTKRRVRVSHAWYPRSVAISGPNQKSIGQMTKYGRGGFVDGPIPAAAMLFRSRASLERLSTPSLLAAPAGIVADALLASWRALALWDSAGSRVEEVSRFDAGFDTLTDRCQSWERWWCRHDAEFLNWRYLEHPTYSFCALAVVEDEQPRGYCVLRLDEGSAAIVDLAVDPTGPAGSARLRALLRAAALRAREAGAAHLSFFAPAGWPHWPALRRTGFVPYPAKNYFSCRALAYEPEVNSLDNWQLMPGDRDFR